MVALALVWTIGVSFVGGLHFRFTECRIIVFESKLLINYYGMVKTIQNLAVHYFVNFNQRVHWKSLIIHTVKRQDSHQIMVGTLF